MSYTCNICVGHENGEDEACIECHEHTSKPCGRPAAEWYDPDGYGTVYLCADHFDRLAGHRKELRWQPLELPTNP